MRVFLFAQKGDKMVKKYFRRGGTWQYSHNNATLSNYTTVNVGFLRDGNEEDETQFDIEKYNVGELNELFDEFVKENNFSNVKVLYVEIVKTARTIEELED